MSRKSGYIEEIDVSKTRILAQYLNAIRKEESDILDIEAGIVFNKKVGDKISIGEIMLYIYTNDDTKIDEAMKKAEKIMVITDKRVKKKSKIEYQFM